MSKERFKVRAAVYLILEKGDQVLLLRRFNTGWMDGKYSLVAGHLDGGESIYATMIREAKEEAGIEVKREDLTPAHAIHRSAEDQEYVGFFFACKKWQGEPKIMEPNKCDDLSWFSINELPENLIPYIGEAIKNYKQGVAFSETGWK